MFHNLLPCKLKLNDEIRNMTFTFIYLITILKVNTYTHSILGSDSGIFYHKLYAGCKGL